MANFLFDDFSGTPPGEDLSLHVPSVGGTWIQHPSYADTIFDDYSNGYLNGSAGADFGIYYNNVSPAGPDYSVIVHIFIVATGGPSYPGCCVRVATGANTMYYVYFDQADLKLHLRKVVAGSLTNLATGSVHSIGINETHNIELRVVGTLLTISWDGGLDFTFNDSDISAAGKAAVLQYSSLQQQVTFMRADDISTQTGLPFFTTVDAKRI